MPNKDGFEELCKFVKKYPDFVKKEAGEIIQKEAKQAAKDIRSDSPVRKHGTSTSAKGKPLPRGTYAKGWRSKATDDGLTYKVYNSGQQKTLGHLLEFGHKMPNGGRAKAIPHILKNRNETEDRIFKELERKLEDAGT